MKRKNAQFIGIVERGEGIALQDYDIATANLCFDSIIPLDSGVYAAFTEYNGKIYQSIVCYGVGVPKKFEVHLFGFEKEIYGEILQVTVVEKVSEIIPWESRERMRQKIIHDVELVQEVFKKNKGTL